MNSDGHTALHLAVFGDRAECIRLLLLAGADSNVQDNNGRTVLHYAAAAGKGCCPLICDGDTSVNLVDEDEDTALHIAYYGHSGIVKKLLGFSANPDARNDNGSLPMHLAAMMGHADCLEPLIQFDSDVNLRNYSGRTPLGEARINNHKDCVALFHKYYILEVIVEKQREMNEQKLRKSKGMALKRPPSRYGGEAAMIGADWPMHVPTVDEHWTRLKSESHLFRKIYKWEEYVYDD